MQDSGRPALSPLHSTIAERVATALRERIIMAHPGFTPGSRVLPAQLAADLGVSMTPIKDALRMLAADGLIRLDPRRGAHVVHLDAAELVDLIDVRFGMERLALEMARARGMIVASDLVVLEDCMAICEEALKRDDVLTYRQGDTDFHQAVVDLARSLHLRKSYRTLLSQAQIRHAYRPRSQQTMRDSLTEHRVLVDALRANDDKAINGSLAEHWRQSYQRLLESFRDQPQVPAPPILLNNNPYESR